MGLFTSKRKEKKSEISDRSISQEEINRLWKEAYQANPKVYEKTDGTLLAGFSLTEDTCSLFPVVPEKQWNLEGKTISEWIITAVSLTNPQGGIIGQIEYHEAMKRLQPFIIAVSGNWALIRAMTHNELDKLFENLPRKLV
ncbi:MAG: hypothetical protein Q4E74_00100 [Ruminococcus sp.]|nr:hypothetical protein [Ruminococcus sp.]